MDKNNKRYCSRREFTAAAVSTAAFTIVPRRVLGGRGFTPPSDKINLAVIGLGRQGMVVMMNLLDHIAHDSAARDVLVEMWRTYVRRTWGRPELKAREKFVAIAEELAPELPASIRELFLVGIGAREGAWDLASVALERSTAITSGGCRSTSAACALASAGACASTAR